MEEIVDNMINVKGKEIRRGLSKKTASTGMPIDNFMVLKMCSLKPVMSEKLGKSNFLD